MKVKVFYFSASSEQKNIKKNIIKSILLYHYCFFSMKENQKFFLKFSSLRVIFPTPQILVKEIKRAKICCITVIGKPQKGKKCETNERR